jgi:D-sedoheptulose 7-phosphate isomerase
LSLFIDNINEHLAVISRLSSLESSVERSSLVIAATIKHKGKVLLCGNGGSAADCQHMAAEFTGRFILDRRPLPAIALTTDTSALTCIGNDYSFDEIFSRQVDAIGSPGDCLIAISTSGNSTNIIRAVEVAKKNGIFTIGLLGRDGGDLKSLCDESIVVDSVVTARIQEAHILIGHTICGAVELALALT